MGDLQIPAKVSTQQQLQPVSLGRIAAIHGPQMADHKTCARAVKPKNGGGIGGFHAWALTPALLHAAPGRPRKDPFIAVLTSQVSSPEMLSTAPAIDKGQKTAWSYELYS